MSLKAETINHHLFERSKVIALQHFLPFAHNASGNVSSQIADYLVKLIERENNEQGVALGCCFLIPSLSTLSEFFNVSMEEMHQSLRKLKLQGHDYFIPGGYGNISVWASPRELKAQSKSPFGSSERIWNVAFIKSKAPSC